MAEVCDVVCCGCVAEMAAKQDGTPHPSRPQHGEGHTSPTQTDAQKSTMKMQDLSTFGSVGHAQVGLTRHVHSSRCGVTAQARITHATCRHMCKVAIAVCVYICGRAHAD